MPGSPVGAMHSSTSREKWSAKKRTVTITGGNIEPCQGISICRVCGRTPFTSTLTFDDKPQSRTPLKSAKGLTLTVVLHHNNPFTRKLTDLR